jgi:crotonobetainyl-CoA:carnitine CoA-transferase CaiB-like acyl-CoA transferase
MKNSPLDGIRVLDFTSMVSGPLCTRLLADCGAEVVKVEPTSGDLLRIVAPHVENQSRYFAAFNCGKKSLVLDLKRPEDVETAAELAERCDVLVENSRPGVMERIGLGYERLRARHPGLVYASISGFGQTGPMADLPAYAPVVHALSGFDAAFQIHQPDPEMPPVTGVQTADVMAAAFAYGAIQTALLRRERTGEGDWVDISLMESIMMAITGDLQAAQVEGARLPSYPPIRTKDHFIAVCIISPKTFDGVVRATGGLGIATAPRTVDENAHLLAELEKWTCQRSTEECQRVFTKNGVPCARYETPKSVLELDHLAARGSFASVDAPGGSFKVNGAPFQFKHATSGIQGGAPDLDEHRDEILTSWLGPTAAD